MLLLLLARNFISLLMLPWHRPLRHPFTNMSEICLFLVIMTSDCASGGMRFISMDNYNFLDDFMSSTAPPITAAPYAPPQWMEPYFDPSTRRNVTALMGKSAYLNCRVRNLGNKTVSWIRHRDLHILTVGSYTYTSDQRFQATHHQDTEDWTLQIKWAQKRDAGMYECQISTQPVRSLFIRLNVVVPTATILGGPDLHVDKGSTINLTCTVNFSPEPPAYIFWYHHEEVINYDSSRGGVSVITEKGDVTTSFLLIQNADLADSGKYSCAPSNADVASVRVHVLNGEHPEAMQTGTCGCQYSWLTICLLLGLVFCYQHKQQTISFNYSSSSHLNLSFTNTTTTTTMTIKPTEALKMVSNGLGELITNKINSRTIIPTAQNIEMEGEQQQQQQQQQENKKEEQKLVVNMLCKLYSQCATTLATATANTDTMTTTSITTKTITIVIIVIMNMKIMSNKINMNKRLPLLAEHMNNVYNGSSSMKILFIKQSQQECKAADCVRKPKILPPMFVLMKFHEMQSSKEDHASQKYSLASIISTLSKVATISRTFIPQTMTNSPKMCH